MKITGSIRSTYVKPTETTARQSKPETGRSSHGEKVEVSSVAQELASARGPETPDTDRIERLRAEIENGTFEVDAEAIAEKMLEEELG
ncbi:MAG: flagellar biosynthesis anti-sigma factor FlgM [Myxococcota bacterium]